MQEETPRGKPRENLLETKKPGEGSPEHPNMPPITRGHFIYWE